MTGSFNITWVDHGREPECASNPAYPDGKDCDARTDRTAPSCSTDLDHPTARCGHYLINCKICGLRIAITTAGRADDPRHVSFNCKPMARA